MSEDITIAIEQNGVMYENEEFVNFKLAEKDIEIKRLKYIIKKAIEYNKKNIHSQSLNNILKEAKQNENRNIQTSKI